MTSWNQAWKIFSLKGHIVHSWGFEGQIVSVVIIQLCPCSAKITLDNSEWICVPIKLYWWILKFEFCIIFMCHKIFFFISPQSFKNVKTILSSWTVQRQMVGQFWPMGHSLLTLLQAVLHRNKSHLYSISCHLLPSFPNYWNWVKNSKNLPLCPRSFSFLHKTWGHWVFFLGLLFISVGSAIPSPWYSFLISVGSTFIISCFYSYSLSTLVSWLLIPPNLIFCQIKILIMSLPC